MTEYIFSRILCNIQAFFFSCCRFQAQSTYM